jgi:molybdenum cofactor cytidylyltransferase
MMGCGNTPESSIALAILAAGAALRFGGGKLEVVIAGEKVGLITACRLQPFAFGARYAICNPGDKALAEGFGALGFDLIANAQPDLGLGHSVSLAAQAADIAGMAGLLICLADMPNITLGHIEAMIAAFGERTIASTTGSTAMPPALFPRSLFPTLITLTGDAGARTLLADAAKIEADGWTLADIDTREDLARISAGYQPPTAPSQDPS